MQFFFVYISNAGVMTAMEVVFVLGKSQEMLADFVRMRMTAMVVYVLGKSQVMKAVFVRMRSWLIADH